MTERVAKNKAVYITYRILDQLGEIVENYDLPIGYVHGANSGLLEKVERSLDGRQVDDVVEVILSPEEGFGEHKPEMTFTDDIDNVPPEFRQVGADVEMQNDKGETRVFKVSNISNGKLTVDGNHPLAGQTIKFILTIARIRDASPQEIANGKPDDSMSPPLPH